MSQHFSVSEFKPTILFLSKFVGIYLIASFLYGLYVTSYGQHVDPITQNVSAETATVLTMLGWPTETRPYQGKPTCKLMYEGHSILSVYEGCNGINTMIVFAAFVIALGPLNKKTLWFVLSGLLLIHLVNLSRITALFFVSKFLPQFMYFTHKYLFTATLYVVIFILWIVWVKKFSIGRK